MSNSYDDDSFFREGKKDNEKSNNMSKNDGQEFLHGEEEGICEDSFFGEEKKDDKSTIMSVEEGEEVWKEEFSQGNEESMNLDEENGASGIFSSVSNSFPAFRCVMFCLQDRGLSSKMLSTSTLETAAADSERNSTSLGLDLLIEEHMDERVDNEEEQQQREVWVIDSIKLNSLLVDSPLQRGDILVTVNGSPDIQHGLDMVRMNHNAVVTLLTYNPDPRADFDLVETWVHPSAYNHHSGDDLDESCHTSIASVEENGFVGLRFIKDQDSEDDFLHVSSSSKEKDEEFWENSLVASKDVLLYVDRVSVQHASERRVTRMIQYDEETSSPVTLHTKLVSTAGLALASTMRQQSKSHVPLNHPSQVKRRMGRIYLGAFVALIATAAAIILILVALNTSKHKDGSISSSTAENEEDSSTPRCEGSGCAIDGRPFRDVRGIDLVASTNQEECSASKILWSTSSEWKTGAKGPRYNDESKPNEWMDRALAEHASIASFSAFTISLMSNGAPPDLVHDALQAAMDEFRHATTSFAFANKFEESGKFLVHEPSALPPSQHLFQADLTALAKATVLEGCIGETLSALDLAYGVDTESGTDTSEILVATKNIALEEANHASLAWRTVRWACQTDSEACQEVTSAVLNPTKMALKFEERFPAATQSQKNAWNDLFTSLLPFAQGQEVTSDQKATYCSSIRDNVGSLMENVVGKIVSSCLCQYNNESERQIVSAK